MVHAGNYEFTALDIFDLVECNSACMEIAYRPEKEWKKVAALPRKKPGGKEEASSIVSGRNTEYRRRRSKLVLSQYTNSNKILFLDVRTTL